LVPELALNLSRGCGNPTGFANLQPGEAVVDLGCGGGIDIILAAHRVGPQGRVVGADFTPQMLDRARETVAVAGLRDRSIELRQVEDMAQTKLPGGSTDVVISNCVINLCPDKDAVYREAFRVLRPGGRVAISDVVLTGDVDTELQARFRSTWAGCLGGAIPEDEYLETVRQAGFAAIEVVAHHPFSPDELQAMACCPGEAFTPAPSTDDLAAVQGKVTSIKFTALKPRASAGELVAATTASSQPTPGPADGRVDEELSRLGEPVAASSEVFKAFVDALVEAERRAASAEARLTALEAEVDELRRLVVRPEVERADRRRSTGDIAMTLEVFERFLRRQRLEERVDEQTAVPAADVDEAEPTREEPAEAPAEEPEAEAGEPGEEPAEAPAEEPEAEAGEPGEEPEAEPAETPAQEPAEAPAEEPEVPAPEVDEAEEPEVPAPEVDEAESAGKPAGEVEISVGRLSESVTATIAITLPPAGSVRVQWDFRSELARR
jgi:SAM-dependent methyltransferase